MVRPQPSDLSRLVGNYYRKKEKKPDTRPATRILAGRGCCTCTKRSRARASLAPEKAYLSDTSLGQRTFTVSYAPN